MQEASCLHGGVLERTYWIIAIPASLFFLFVLVTTFIGGDVDGDVEADGNETGEMGFQFFTFKNLVAFFTIFSWVGLGCVHSGYGNGLSIAISTFSGLLMMVIMSTLFYFMTKLVEDGTMQLSNALGNTGKVYLPIKAGKGGFGKVQIKIQGALHEIQALTNDEEDLSVGTVIQVKEVIDDSILLVTSKLT